MTQMRIKPSLPRFAGESLDQKSCSVKTFTAMKF